MTDNVIEIWRKQERENAKETKKTKKSLLTCVRTSVLPFSQCA